MNNDNFKSYFKNETQVVEGKNVVYLATSDESEKDGIYTVGKAINLNMLQAYNFKIIKYISCNSIQLMDSIEKIILENFNKYKIVTKKDVFQLPTGKDVSFFVKKFGYYLANCEKNIVLEERSDEEQQEDKSEYNKKYCEEHHDVLDREKFFREILERYLD